MGGDNLNNFSRTANCKKCGSTNLKINSKNGEVEFICGDCGEVVGSVKYEPYSTLRSKCNSCNSEIFKVKITDTDDVPYWSVSCSKCEISPSIKYVDSDGNEIEREVRELLIIKDEIKELRNEVSSLESDLRELESKTCSIDYAVDNHENEITNLKNELEGFENSISDLDWKIKHIS
jgi:predicted RNase H-like nuclease (RuvC/YqgF family)